MCGRFSQSKPASAYARFLAIPGETGDRTGRFNVAPSLPVAVVTRRGPWPNGTPTNRMDWCTWGLVPHWVHDPQTLKTRPINARIETVADKPMFRDAWRRGQRGLVPTDGFYEWRTEHGGRQPWFIRRRDGTPLLLAALWDTWGPDHSLSCTLLVGPPNERVARLHARMPIIIPRDALDVWLDAHTPADTLAAFAAPFPSVELEAYRVSTWVNRADNEGAQCIAPLSSPP
ncbi:MAG: SOS response-associated peptidase [Thiohalomonadaceae bacterium]